MQTLRLSCYVQSLIVMKVLLFQLNSQNMILTASDAIESVQLGDNEEEALNEVSHWISFPDHLLFASVLNGISQITLNHNESKLAFTMDTGVVGVVDLITKKSSRMRVQHANVSPCIMIHVARLDELYRLAGLLNSSLIDRTKSLVVATIVPYFTLISCKAAYFHGLTSV